MNLLSSLIESAKKEIGYRTHHDGAGNVRAVTSKPAASVATVSLRELQLPPMVGAGRGHAATNPLGTAAGKKTNIDAALIEQSRVAKAGAVVIVVPTAATAVGIGPTDGVALYKREASFTTIEAAPFAIVADDADVAESSLPLLRDLIDFETIPAYGFRVSLSRAEQKAFGDGVLTDGALASIALGLAKAADACLLSAIAAANPAAFTLASVASRGLSFGELRALVGSAANGASVGADGVLRAAGVSAELTSTVPGTYVGAFNRSAVAISEDVTLLAERRNAQGDLVLTCFANMQALLPDASAFWTVGA